MMVPYPAGDHSDTLARVIAERLKTALGQTVIIENVTGAGGRSAPAWSPARRPTATRWRWGTSRRMSSMPQRRALLLRRGEIATEPMTA